MKGGVLKYKPITSKHTLCRYSWGKSWLVIGLWPVLALLSSSFRQELRTAIVRRSDTEPVRVKSSSWLFSGMLPADKVYCRALLR